ncbi:hypothetical protein RclHR1_00850026 [Rhizophagus clarus]|uniref:Uncharacterized protein n=1 Tax=Rhizophagus clarus TaxID=94130 RepID=A0A2Z6SC18_9GLOM|nr:hypothetical protein RclHR1_00850026 [Rhizophagus clarus]GES98088.1 hypothetical protein GLOIN_2v1471941 [Rhizophagus clarus]
MNTNNPSPNNFNNNAYGPNSQTTVTQAYDTHAPFADNGDVVNNLNNYAYGPNSQTTVTQAYDTYPPFADNDDVVNNSLDNQQYQQSQQQYDTSNNIPYYNYQQHQQNQQYIQQPNDYVTVTSNYNHQQNYQQPMANVISNNGNNGHASNHDNNLSPPQFYHDQNQPNPPQQPNILPSLNSSGINISSHATIVIMPTTNSDIQNQLQQVLAYLNHSSSRFNTK